MQHQSIKLIFKNFMSNVKIINIFFVVLYVSVISSFFIEDIRWRKNLLKTGVLVFPHPLPYYEFMHVPGTSPKSTSKGALGADFSQVFFSAKAIRNGESAYNPQSPEFKDRFGRRPNYPPLTNWLYIPLTYLPYHQALIIHNFGTIFLFFLLTAYLMKQFGLLSYVWKIFVLYILLYFYTTLGFSHFERGQFDFFVASSYLLIFSCVFSDKKSLLYAFASGLFGSIKWSSLPFLGTFSVFAFLGINSRRRWLFILILCVMLFSVIVFLPQIYDYLPSLQLYEFSAIIPRGVSFTNLMPKILAKSIQVLCTLIIIIFFMLFTQKQTRINLFKSISLPFALAMAIQGMCYGTISYEYRIVSILGLIPAFIVWSEKTNVSLRLKFTVAIFFATFLIIAFRVFNFFKANWQPVLMTTLYLVCSLFCLILCAYIIIRYRNLLVAK